MSKKRAKEAEMFFVCDADGVPITGTGSDSALYAKHLVLIRTLGLGLPRGYRVVKYRLVPVEK